MIIDAHIYCLPPRLREPNCQLPEMEGAIIHSIYLQEKSAHFLPLAAPEVIAEAMHENNISGAALVAFPWRSPELCRENNEFILEITGDNPSLHAICSVQPAELGWESEVESSLAAGAVGIKINPTWQGGELDDKNVQELAKLIATKNCFLMTHVDYAYKKSVASPAHLLELARARPETRILAAHLGGLLGLYTLYEPLRETIKNVWFDTAVSATMEQVKFFTEIGLGERLIYGSDFPFNHSFSLQQPLEAFHSLELPAGLAAGILANNFCRLIGE